MRAASCEALAPFIHAGSERDSRSDPIETATGLCTESDIVPETQSLVNLGRVGGTWWPRIPKRRLGEDREGRWRPGVGARGVNELIRSSSRHSQSVESGAPVALCVPVGRVCFLDVIRGRYQWRSLRIDWKRAWIE